MSRLTPNEPSPVANLFNFLVEVQSDPVHYVHNADLIDALKSQGALASLEVKDRGITPCSLNTLKKRAAENITGGFQELDRLRSSVLNKLLQNQKSTEFSSLAPKALLQKRLEKERQENAILRNDLWHMSRAFFKAMSNGRGYATESGNPALVIRCADDEKELRAMVSLVTEKSIVNERSTQ